MESKLEAFEVWAYRRMLRVSWTEHKTNEEVLKMAIQQVHYYQQ